MASYDDDDLHQMGYGRRDPEPDTDYKFFNVSPYDWQMPESVEPEDEASTKTSAPKDYGTISTDATLYVLKEQAGDKVNLHTVLKMPSALPGVTTVSTNTFNIMMVDASGSMDEYWLNVEQNWNKYVAPNLVGITRIFTFDSSVKYRRSTPTLTTRDFSRGGTELTGALQTIITEIFKCKQKNVNVFIVTDGSHNGSSVHPTKVISMMKPPAGKVCNVYVLGAGNYFPVQYSIDIRSRLHSGSSNIPTLFWAKTAEDVEEQMKDIAGSISGGASISLKLDTEGAPLPGLECKTTFHLEEWVYLSGEPNKYKEVKVTFNRNTAKISLHAEEVDVKTLLDIFRQWNSVIIQQKCKQGNIPPDILQLMERLFNTLMSLPRASIGHTLAERLEEKKFKGEELEFRTLLNTIRSILTTEKFKNEIELAESILSTTVKRSKYEVKTLQLKGHTDKEYENDCKEFMKVYEANKESIKSLKVSPDYLCRHTQTSTLSDMQEESFPLLMEKNKFDFLKAITISGIPVFAPSRDSVTLNPWSFSVQRIVGAPYTMMSQIAMESMVQGSTDTTNKEVQAKQGDESTNFNAVVPVFPPNAAKVMQAIVRTRLYAMCVTFATLKNPHIIDFNVHMASLGVTWVRCLFEHPANPRPEYVRVRMESIEATAAMYLDRPGYANYISFLKDKTCQALMTESIEQVNMNPVKCETLIKPMFFLQLIQRSDNKFAASKVAEIIRLILLEYVGRCLAHYKSKEGDDTPFTDFFAESLDDQEKKKKWVQKFVEDAKKNISNPEEGLLKSFYTLEKVRKAAIVIAKEEMERNKVDLISDIPLKVSVEKVKQLRSVTTAGDVSLNTIEIFAREVGLGEDMIRTLFSEESMTVYTVHALLYRSSRERLQKEVVNYTQCMKTVKAKVQEENLKLASKDLFDALVANIEKVWLDEYLDVHNEVVEPMARQQIVTLARQNGIEVTEATFDQVYKKYRPNVGLLCNACQTKKCPYFLKPDKTYNQHASVERLKGRDPFMHALHNTIFVCRNEDVNHTIKEIVSGKNTKDKKTLPADAVKKWSGDIKKLKNIYHEKEKASQGNP